MDDGKNILTCTIKFGPNRQGIWTAKSDSNPLFLRRAKTEDAIIEILRSEVIPATLAEMRKDLSESGEIDIKILKVEVLNI